MRPLPRALVVTVAFVLVATSLIAAKVGGLFALVFIAPVGCVCAAWTIFFAASHLRGLHLMAGFVDTAIVAQWLIRRIDPMYDASQTWWAMITLWILVFAQGGLFLYTHRETI